MSVDVPGRLSAGTLSAAGGEMERAWRIGRRGVRVGRSEED